MDPQSFWNDQKNKAKFEQSNTFESVAKSWFDIKVNEVTASYANDIWRSFEVNLFPTLGKQPIVQVDAPALISALKPVEARGALETVRRLCQRINEVMNYATNIGLIKANPAVGIKAAFVRPIEKNLPSLRPEELPIFLKALSCACISLSTRAVIEWQLHTMTRPSEAAGTKWSEIDIRDKLWTIPAERMKKNRPHTIPLTDQAIEILEIMKPISGNREHVFIGSKDPLKPMNSSTANAAIKRMGFKGKLVAHGLRSIASTTLNEKGFNADIIEAALAHLDTNEVRRAYNRAQYLEKRREMMCWWSNKIDKCAEGKFTISSYIK